jgi:hypothetical protein
MEVDEGAGTDMFTGIVRAGIESIVGWFRCIEVFHDSSS